MVLPRENQWISCSANSRGWIWAGPGAGAPWDSALSRSALVEKKTNELLLMESILRYMSADGSHPAQPFANPLLDGTGLLRLMDRARLCPPPPAPDGTTDAIDACECVRREGGAGATPPANPQFPCWLPSQSPALSYPPQPIPTSLPHPTGYIRPV